MKSGEHKWQYSDESLREILTVNGFEVKEVNYPAYPLITGRRVEKVLSKLKIVRRPHLVINAIKKESLKKWIKKMLMLRRARILQDEIEKKVESEKLTTVNICLTILAFFYESDLREEDDFYVTTTSRGRRNYHP